MILDKYFPAVMYVIILLSLL